VGATTIILGAATLVMEAASGRMAAEKDKRRLTAFQE